MALAISSRRWLTGTGSPDGEEMEGVRIPPTSGAVEPTAVQSYSLLDFGGAHGRNRTSRRRATFLSAARVPLLLRLGDDANGGPRGRRGHMVTQGRVPPGLEPDRLPVPSARGAALYQCARPELSAAGCWRLDESYLGSHEGLGRSRRWSFRLLEHLYYVKPKAVELAVFGTGVGFVVFELVLTGPPRGVADDDFAAPGDPATWVDLAKLLRRLLYLSIIRKVLTHRAFAASMTRWRRCSGRSG
jgi:hypothetical protein